MGLSGEYLPLQDKAFSCFLCGKKDILYVTGNWMCLRLLDVVTETHGALDELQNSIKYKH
jgi:hypothetical protein